MGSILRAAKATDIRKICIIGSGPSGLAAAKHLLAENSFDTIDILEQQAEIGGVWNYTPPITEHVPVPQTTPETLPDKPIWPKDGTAPIFSNPMYETLNTNIPKGLMNFSDLEFPADSLLFPTRQDVQKYLLRYAQDVRHLIQFSTQVEEIRHSTADGQDQWNVRYSSCITSEKREQVYDALVVACGHYSVAFIPEVPGIEAFNSAYPEIISHSKTYRSPAYFKGKKVIVVGAGPSGLDIGTQISQVSQKPLLNSVRKSSPFNSGQEDKEEVPAIAEYLIEERGVKFTDGRVERDIDAIVYCTGYLYSYHFLTPLDPPVVTDGRRARGLYRQLFNITYPSIAFTALSQRVIPFPLSEGQGAAIAKVWSNKLALPSKEEMFELEQKQVDELGDGTGFHLLPYPKDAAYINDLHDWVKSAKGGFTKPPAFWNEKQCWVRENFGEMRKAFIAGGKKAKSMEELGFDYEKKEKLEEWTIIHEVPKAT